MTIEIVAVGKVKSKPLAAIIETYQKRLRAPWSIQFLEIKEGKSQDVDSVKSKEGTAILKHLDKRWVVALEERGDLRDSVEWSQQLVEWMDDGKKIAFVIGGAAGLSPEIQNRADATVSLSTLTFPHELARTILVEQIYRAMTIAQGTAYHK